MNGKEEEEAAPGGGGAEAEAAQDIVPGLDTAEAAGKAGKVRDVALKGNPDEIGTWLHLAEEAGKASSAGRAREMYEKLLRRFPLAEKYWVLYCQLEYKSGAFDRVERLLKRTLLTLGSVNLWLFYLTYVRERKLGKNSEAASNPQMEKAARVVVKDAFEFALKHIGFVYEAGRIWQEYIRFIESETCDTQFDLGQRAIAVEAAFARAIKVPIESLEDVYKQFQEKHRGAIPAEVSEDYMKAKAVYLERKKRMQGLDYGGIPLPYNGNQSDDKTLQRWRELIAYERSDPERSSETRLKLRVRHVFTKALSAMYFYPELWYEFSQYELETNDPISSKTVLEKALHALPDSLLLHLVVAEAHEQQGRIDHARDMYAKLEKRHPCSVVFVQSQQFERRVGGVAAARAAFRRARQSPACDSNVFTAAALMEFHNNKEARVARNVFELGMKRFPKDVGFIVQYMRFLEHLNEDSDLITLYERVLAQLDPREAFTIWERYREFCARFVAGGGSLKMLATVEKRMAESYPDRASYLRGFAGVVHRYAFLGQHPSEPSDISFFERTKRLSLGPHARMFKGMPLATAEAQRIGGAVALGSPTNAAEGGRAAGFQPIGAADSSKTPASVRKLEALLPESLGATTRPLPASYMINQLRAFRLPSKAFFAPKKKRKIALDNNDAEATDIFKKRRK